jgi:hypothetical protein
MDCHLNDLPVYKIKVTRCCQIYHRSLFQQNFWRLWWGGGLERHNNTSLFYIITATRVTRTLSLLRTLSRVKFQGGGCDNRVPQNIGYTVPCTDFWATCSCMRSACLKELRNPTRPQDTRTDFFSNSFRV